VSYIFFPEKNAKNILSPPFGVYELKRKKKFATHKKKETRKKREREKKKKHQPQRIDFFQRGGD
jgi:hypothetical protein